MTDRRSARIAIVGGGVSGLYAAWLLDRQGVTDWLLIEGREVLGGRILSVPAPARAADAPAQTTRKTDRFDLGPSWFWPGYQHQLDRLVQELGLERFGQHESGDMMVERSPDAGPVRMRGYLSSPPSMRLVPMLHTLGLSCSRTGPWIPIPPRRLTVTVQASTP